MALRRVAFYRVLHRPNQFLGGDREIGLMVTVIAITLPAVGQSVPTVAVGVGLWALVLPILRWAGKQDPQWRHVYGQQLKYRKFYLACSTPFRAVKPHLGEKIFQY